MPLYKINIEGEGLDRTYDLQLMRPSTYSAEQLKERQDLQALLLKRPDAIDKDILILREEFDSWQDSKRRIDLLAIDKEANLVVIELKVEEEGGHMELQAIRYAAMVSAMDFEAVVRAREHFLTKQNIDPTTARQEVLQHLGMAEEEEPVIGNQPRIILIAPSFSKEITTTVLWLNSAGLDIRCLETKPYNLEGVRYLDIKQVLPLPAAADYVVKIAEKAREEDKRVRAGSGKAMRTIDVLLDAGVLEPGQRLKFMSNSINGHLITDEAARGAEFLGTGTSRNEVKWDADGQTYSLSGLCNVMYEKYSGKTNTSIGFNGNAVWAREGSDISLWEEGQNIIASRRNADSL